ncbi:MAG TPA: redoxin domain-containing protein [Steroidobacteraceae bacterium]|jgi:peroxiredoxin|nr:redoxin domain-containing protein [Steroidobacteraceae bacterium]
MLFNRSISVGRSLLFSLALLFSAGSLASEQPPTLAIGAAMPPFSLPGVDGKTYTDKSFAKADILVLVFTCAHCPTAQAYQERIKKLVTDYSPKNVTLVAINPNHADAVRLDELAYSDVSDSFEELQVRAKDQKFNFVWLDDGPKQEVSHVYGPVATPHVFIFDKARKLRFEGRIDDSERESTATKHETRDAIDALLAGKDPAVTSTKVFGCSVKWADKVPDYANYKKKWAAEPVALEKADAAALKAIRENKDSGKIRLINVWATWCGPCITEFDELVEHNLRFRIRGFEMVTIAAEFPDQETKVRDFLTQKHASMKNYIFASDNKDELSEALDPAWKGPLPYTIVVDEKGTVIYREMGAIDFLKIRRALVPALNRLTPWQGLSPIKPNPPPKATS